MNPVSRVVFDKKYIPDEKEFWEAVLLQIKLLVKTNNIMRCVASGDTFIIDYAARDINKREPFPYFLNPLEAGAAMSAHEQYVQQQYEDFIATTEKVNELVRQQVDMLLNEGLDDEDEDIVEDLIDKKDKNNKA